MNRGEYGAGIAVKITFGMVIADRKNSFAGYLVDIDIGGGRNFFYNSVNMVVCFRSRRKKAVRYHRTALSCVLIFRSYRRIWHLT